MTTATHTDHRLTGLAALDRDAFFAQHDLIWAPHTWPADAVLSVSWDVDFSSGHSAYKSEHLPVAGRDAVWDSIVRHGAESRIFVSIAPRSLTQLERSLAAKNAVRAANGMAPTDISWVRGGPAECYAMPALFADIDCLGGEHSAPNLPTRVEAAALIATFPVGPPTLLLWTGGGFHCWWALRELPERADEDEANSRLSAWLDAAFKASGWHVDGGTQNRSQSTRPAGSLIGKRGDLHAIDLLSPLIGSVAA